MSYSVRLTERAKNQLLKMDKHTALLITGWIRKRLEGCDNPRAFGKPLTANHSGQWRYRTGDYRIIAEIEDDRLIILALNIGHRREVYKDR